MHLQALPHKSAALEYQFLICFSCFGWDVSALQLLCKQSLFPEVFAFGVFAHLKVKSLLSYLDAVTMEPGSLPN